MGKMRYEIVNLRFFHYMCNLWGNMGKMRGKTGQMRLRVGLIRSRKAKLRLKKEQTDFGSADDGI